MCDEKPTANHKLENLNRFFGKCGIAGEFEIDYNNWIDNNLQPVAIR